ncbi:MAG: Gfo/Idh/MocA family oxidoreductase [bacterium]|nr:Gfo/Idh/MocA family oxidoreductase [bacterium]
MARKKIRFGIIGLGLMGREFGSAAARWCHLLTDGSIPEIVGICDSNREAHQWFQESFPSITLVTTDYHELLASDEIEAVYCAVPHHLHEEMYVDIIQAGKHLMGEKPFGIDRAANTHILNTLEAHSDVIVRCSSEFPYFPGVQRMIQWIREERFGRIIEVKAGFNHSSDLDLSKPINWKRMIEFNGEYGCLGDLGIHTQHIPFRVGWIPQSVYAVLSDIVTERPDGKGGMAPCRTYDNATLICDVIDNNGVSFPMYLETKRLEPGATNDWYIEVYGLQASAKFSTRDPKSFYFLETRGKEQAWSRVDLGYSSAFKSITGGIFEFGFPDAILQMWATFLQELEGNIDPGFGCFRPEETRLSHALQTAALKSHTYKRVEHIQT